jgi:hypothetical protein
MVEQQKGDANVSDLHQYGEREQRDVRSEPGQQLGDGDRWGNSNARNAVK